MGIPNSHPVAYRTHLNGGAVRRGQHPWALLRPGVASMIWSLLYRAAPMRPLPVVCVQGSAGQAAGSANAADLLLTLSNFPHAVHRRYPEWLFGMKFSVRFNSFPAVDLSGVLPMNAQTTSSNSHPGYPTAGVCIAI